MTSVSLSVPANIVVIVGLVSFLIGILVGLLGRVFKENAAARKKSLTARTKGATLSS